MFNIFIRYMDNGTSRINNVKEYHYNSTYECFVITTETTEIHIPRENIRSIEYHKARVC